MAVMYEHYPVAGSTIAELRRATMLLGPTREGRTFPAYTDWQIEWSLAPTALAQGWVPGELAVQLRAVVTLPRWHAPTSVPAGLVTEWAQHIHELEEHEQGHVAIAVEAAHVLRETLLVIGPCPSADALRSLAVAEADTVLAQARADDLAYDRAAAESGRVDPPAERG